jgi:hypothetical protein
MDNLIEHMIFTLCRRLTIGRLQRQIKEFEMKAPAANSLADETENLKTNKEELQQVQ